MKKVIVTYEMRGISYLHNPLLYWLVEKSMIDTIKHLFYNLLTVVIEGVTYCKPDNRVTGESWDF